MKNNAIEDQKADQASGAAQCYVARFHAFEFLGNWFVKDLDDSRIICMCNRQKDSEKIAESLNAKAT